MVNRETTVARRVGDAKLMMCIVCSDTNKDI